MIATAVRRGQTRPYPQELDPVEPRSFTTTSMGGRLVVHLPGDTDPARAGLDARRVQARVARWADRLSRHLATSELSALNDAPGEVVPVGPTLAGALRAGRGAAAYSDGLVDIGMLGHRLAAEGLSAGTIPGAHRDWTLVAGHRGAAVVHRPPGLRFDLGGVAKGWIADRALGLLATYASAVVDADGDLAIRAAPGRLWRIAVDDPRAPGAMLAVLQLGAPASGLPERWGVATSGTSVHRWRLGREMRHHIIDPRTGAPAVTDVVQATVVAGSALRAEALAKAAVIGGSADGLAMLEHAGVCGAIVLTERGESLALPSTLGVLVH